MAIGWAVAMAAATPSNAGSAKLSPIGETRRRAQADSLTKQSESGEGANSRNNPSDDPGNDPRNSVPFPTVPDLPSARSLVRIRLY